MKFSDLQIQHFLNIAREESLKSSCLRTSVGAIIVDAKGSVLSVGHNAPPPSLPNSRKIGFCNKEKLGYKSGEGYHVCRSIHAEQRAILEIGVRQTKGQSIFIFGHTFICHQCQLFILLAEIQNIFLQASSQVPYKRCYPQDLEENLLKTFRGEISL